MPVRIAHISDPHFGTATVDVVAALRRTLLDLSPDLVLITGDITQRARFRQFRDARRFVKSLAPLEVVAVPGNHDIPLFNVIARLFYPYWGYLKIFKGTLNREVAREDVHVLALNSTRWFRHIQGQIHPRTLRSRLKKIPDRARVRIVAYHHPMDCPKHADEKNLLKNRDEIMAILAESGVDAVLGGHIHDPFIALSSERYPTLRPLVISLAGTCLSWRIRANAPNSFNLIEVVTQDSPRLRISRYDVDRNMIFQPIQSEQFIRRGDAGWA
ncbi:MAG: metallophosphoesterase [Bdellovibrionaceae bacterium]|nr:metallophosphoesterase [Pseudobdellovibrionaceae bacterium]